VPPRRCGGCRRRLLPRHRGAILFPGQATASPEFRQERQAATAGESAKKLCRVVRAVYLVLVKGLGKHQPKLAALGVHHGLDDLREHPALLTYLSSTMSCRSMDPAAAVHPYPRGRGAHGAGRRRSGGGISSASGGVSGLSSMSCRSMDPSAAVSQYQYRPREVEFSCSSTPLHRRRRAQRRSQLRLQQHGQWHDRSSAAEPYGSAATVSRLFELMDVKEEAAAEAMTTDIDDEDGDVVAWPAVVVPAPRQVRITDSPFPAWEADGDDDEEGRLGVVDRLAARGRPATCVVYAFLMWWAADVARERGIPRVLYWIQPATMLAVYYHYLHGLEELVTEHAGEPEFTVDMPGLPPMAIRDLPSFFTDLADTRLAAAFHGVRTTIEQLDIDRRSSSKPPMVLVNTVEELELDVLAASFPDLDILPIGPAATSLDGGGAAAAARASHDLYRHDEKGYMEWLDAKPAGSVVYVSFGSMSVVSRRQKEELRRGLAATARPYLWVVRSDDRDDGDGDGDGGGMVVEWCDQVRVLSHGAVGCFVTHCGWNSTLEAVACGAPMVAVPPVLIVSERPPPATAPPTFTFAELPRSVRVKLLKV